MSSAALNIDRESGLLVVYDSDDTPAIVTLTVADTPVAPNNIGSAVGREVGFSYIDNDVTNGLHVEVLDNGPVEIELNATFSSSVASVTTRLLLQELQGSTWTTLAASYRRPLLVPSTQSSMSLKYFRDWVQGKDLDNNIFGARYRIAFQSSGAADTADIYDFYFSFRRPAGARSLT